MPGTPEHCSSWKEAELVLGTAVVCLAKKATTAYLNSELSGIFHTTSWAHLRAEGCGAAAAGWV